MLMSEELVGRVDPDSLIESGLPEDAREVTRSPVLASLFSCGVTPSDGEELLGDVVSFQKGRTKRSVSFRSTDRVLDDVASAVEITRIRVFTRLETEVFDVEFDPDDPFDQPEISFEFTALGPVLTLSFEVEADTYPQEDSPDDHS